MAHQKKEKEQQKATKMSEQDEDKVESSNNPQPKSPVTAVQPKSPVPAP